MAVNPFLTNAGVMKKLRQLQEQLPDEFGNALRQEAELEATECKKRCPVETGSLRATIHAEGPKREGRKISASVEAGGPGTDYALIVHEDLEAFHKTGEAKFIERPLAEAVPYMAERIAKRIDLNKA